MDSPSFPQNKTLTAQISGLFLGPMPIKMFLDRFLPARSSLPSSRSAFKKAISSKKGSRDTVLGQLIQALSKFLPSGCVRLGWTADTTSDQSVDVAVYESAHTTCPATDFNDISCFVDVSLDDELDPFDDHPLVSDSSQYPFERETDHAITTRARLAASVNQIIGRQSRLHVFTVIIFGRRARLMRWDPAGVIVTEAFRFDQTKSLAEFFWRFDGMSSAARGHDPSVVRLSPESPTHIASLDVLDDLRSRNSSGHRYFSLVKVPSRDHPQEEHDFLVSFPLKFDHSSPVGRATRHTFAYDVGLGRIVFLKQYWRAVMEGRDKEGDTYALLSSRGVRYLPTFGKGNDVRGYSSVTQALRDDPGRVWGYHTRHPFEFRLYRMSLDTIGRPLVQFRSARELVTTIRDAMICHDDAFFKAKILHADISSSNIMINPLDGHGLLIDWDTAVNLDKVDAQAPPPRAGTRRFLSARLLSKPELSHSLADDRESFLWVLLWVSLHYSPHNQTESMDWWIQLFDGPRPSSGRSAESGFRKRYFLLEDSVDETIDFRRSPGLVRLIEKLQQFFRCRYAARPITKPSVLRLCEAGGHPIDPKKREMEVQQYNYAIENLSTKGKLVELFSDILQSEDAWSQTDDPATPQLPRLPSQHTSSRKRSASDADLVDSNHLLDVPQHRSSESQSADAPPLISVKRRSLRKPPVVPPSDRVLRSLPTRVARLPGGVNPAPRRSPRQAPRAAPTPTTHLKPAVAGKSRKKSR